MISKDFFRGIGLYLAGVLLSLLLFVAAGTLMIRSVIGEPDAVKSTLVRSGVYDHFLGASLDRAQKAAKNNGDSKSDIPLDDPIIKDSLKQAYGPEVLRVNFENLIDGSYHWLNGSVAQPDFVMDFSASNEIFIQSAGERLRTRLVGLPVCSAQQLENLQDTDVFRATCLPQGLEINELVDDAKSSLRANKNLLPNQIITADTLKKPGESQNVFAGASNAPKQFQSLKQTPWILLGLILLLAAAIVLLSPDRASGVKRLGKYLIISGILLLLVALGLYFAPSTLIDQKSIAANPLAKNITVPLLAEVGKAAAKVYVIFGSLILVAGGLMWLAVHRLKK